MKNSCELFPYLNLNYWDKETNDIPSEDLKKWLRLEDPTGNYKNSLKK